MTKEELRDRLINIKAITDYENDNPFVSIWFEKLFELFEEFEGQDLLYVCNKTAERTEKRIIDKTCMWFLNHTTYFNKGNIDVELLIKYYKETIEQENIK